MLFLLLLPFWFSVFQRSPRGKEGGIFAPCGKNLPCVVVFSQIRLKLPTSFSKKPFLFSKQDVVQRGLQYSVLDIEAFVY